MTAVDVPAAIGTFIDATNRGDSEAFVAAFTEDAHLYDYGREFQGRDRVRDWNRTDNIGAQAHFDLVTRRRVPIRTVPASQTARAVAAAFLSS
ncbi:nuclear transport factor 2 family protein [Streptomyces sp. NPDC047841]|uniref:nuclear transport factor 2 family protein n=1 Tax=Streptomyces sp. NPDC047841 TaxID=3154708 RepID=UPI00345458DB